MLPRLQTYSRHYRRVLGRGTPSSCTADLLDLLYASLGWPVVCTPVPPSLISGCLLGGLTRQHASISLWPPFSGSFPFIFPGREVSRREPAERFYQITYQVGAAALCSNSKRKFLGHNGPDYKKLALISLSPLRTRFNVHADAIPSCLRESFHPATLGQAASGDLSRACTESP